MNFVIHCLCATFYDKYTVMRLREFAKIKEAPMGPGGGAIGGAIGDFAKRVVYLPNMWLELYKQYKADRLSKAKAKTKREKVDAAKKEAETKKELEKVASKMNPKEKEVAKKEVEKSHSTAPTIRLVKGQIAKGGDGQEYVFGGGGQWINTSTGDDAKKDVAHTLFKQFLP